MLWYTYTWSATYLQWSRYTRHTLQRTATHCNTLILTLQHTTYDLERNSSRSGVAYYLIRHSSYAMCCNVLQSVLQMRWMYVHRCLVTLYTLQHAFQLTLQHTATHCNTLQHTLQEAATHCNSLQHTRYDLRHMCIEVPRNFIVRLQSLCVFSNAPLLQCVAHVLQMCYILFMQRVVVCCSLLQSVLSNTLLS